MKATAIIYDMSRIKGREKTYLIRELFGYKDTSNRGQYRYERPGMLTPYIYQKWGKSVIVVMKHKEGIVKKVLEKHDIKFREVGIEVESG